MRTGEDVATIEAHLRERRRRAARPPRDYGAGPQPRVRQRHAGHGRRADAICRRAHRAPRPARASDAARRRHPSRRPGHVWRSDRSAATRSGSRSSPCRRSARRARSALTCRAAGTRDRASSSITFQLAELDRARSSDGGSGESRGRRSRRPAQVLASAERVERLCAESYAALYERRRRDPRRPRAASGGAVGELATLDRALPDRTSTRATASSRSSRTWRRSSGATRDGDRGLAGTPAGGRGAARPSRTAEAQARADAGATCIAKPRCASPRAPRTSTRRRAHRRSSDASTRAARTEYSRQAGRAVAGRRRAARRSCAKALEDELAALAMERTRLRGPVCADAAVPRIGVDRARASIRAEFYVSPNPAKTCGRWRVSCPGGELSRIMLAIKTLTATSRHGFSDVDGTAAAAPRRQGSSSTRSTPESAGRVADVVGRKLRAARLGVSGALHHAPAADRRVRRQRTFRSKAASRRRTGTSDGHAGCARRRARRRSRPYARRRSDHRWHPRVRPVRCWRSAPRGRPAQAEAKRRKRGESEREADNVTVAQKYLIETFGCQMNVHDSERMAGLPRAGGLRDRRRRRRMPTSVVINTCSVRERAEGQALPRLGELRELAARALRPRPADRRASPAAWRSRKARRSSGARPASPMSSSGRRRFSRLPMLVEQAERRSAPVAIDLNPHDDVTLAAGRDAAGRSGQGVRHDHRGVQRVLQLLRRAVSARARADAAESRTSSPKCARRPPAAAGKCSCSGRSSTTTRRPTTPGATSRACSRRSTHVDGHRAHPLCEPASAALRRSISGARCAVCRRSAGTCICRCSRVDAGPRGDAAPLHAREYLDLVARIRDDAAATCALSTDMIVGFPGETDADFEETLR